MLERILVTGVLFVALLVLEHVGILEQITQPVLIFIIYLVPYLLIGYDIIFKAFRNISHGQVFDENFLMMIATLEHLEYGSIPRVLQLCCSIRLENFSRVMQLENPDSPLQI